MNLPFFFRTLSYFLMFGAMLLLERSAPYTESVWQKRFRVAFHLGISIANSILLYLIITWPLFASLSYSQTNLSGIRHMMGLNGWNEVIATLVVFDIWEYWMHVANHRIGFLWRFHKAHHSDMDLDVTTASRFHIGELVISGLAKSVMIIVWGPSLWGLVIFDIMLTAASQFHHCNVNIPFDMQTTMEKIVVTPRMHRCHHALSKGCLDANFSSILSFWDRLFRSYHWATEKLELEKVGLFKPRGPETMQIRAFLMTPFT